MPPSPRGLVTRIPRMAARPSLSDGIDELRPAVAPAHSQDVAVAVSSCCADPQPRPSLNTLNRPRAPIVATSGGAPVVSEQGDRRAPCRHQAAMDAVVSASIISSPGGRRITGGDAMAAEVALKNFPSAVRSNTAPQASSSRTRSELFACSSVIRQLFRWPVAHRVGEVHAPAVAVATLASAASRLPPSPYAPFQAATWTGRRPWRRARAASIAAAPAPLALMTSTSCSSRG